MPNRTPPVPAGAGGRIAVHVVEPSRLLDGSEADGSEADGEAFDRVYAMGRFSPHAESFVFLEGEPRLFLKCRWIRSWTERDWVTQSPRLVNEIHNLERFRRAGVPVPDTLAWGVDRRMGVPVRSFLVLRVLEDSWNLRELLERTEPDDPQRVEALEAAGAVARRLHDAHLFHRDLTARNVLFQRDGERLRATLIDCPRAVSSALPLRRAALRRSDVLRLSRSVLRHGSTEAEMRALLGAIGASDLDEMSAQAMRRREEGRNRSWRTRVWVMTGF